LFAPPTTAEGSFQLVIPPNDGRRLLPIVSITRRHGLSRRLIPACLLPRRMGLYPLQDFISDSPTMVRFISSTFLQLLANPFDYFLGHCYIGTFSQIPDRTFDEVGPTQSEKRSRWISVDAFA